MEKETRVTAYVSDITTLIIEGELDADRYADSWLALCNNKRETKEFLELRNYYDSNKITAIIDVTDTIDNEETIESCKDFFSSWGVNIKRVTIEEAKRYLIEEYQLDEDKPVYLELDM